MHGRQPAAGSEDVKRNRRLAARAVSRLGNGDLEKEQLFYRNKASRESGDDSSR